MNRFHMSCVALAALMAFNAPAFAADTSEIVKKIDKIASAAVADGEDVGLQVAVYKDGKPVLVKSYGLANIELKAPVTNESVFRIGSISKQFTATAIALLIEDGKLSVTDKLAKFYPNFPRAKDITVDQLLHHTSGIHNFLATKDIKKEELAHHTTDEMIAFISKMEKTQDFEPGTSWLYSNSGYFILGGIVEKVSGQTFADFLKTRLFKPLGMTHTALDDETEIVPGRVAGYAASAPGKFTNASFISLSVPGGAGSIRSSAEDLGKWNAALYGGKIVKPAMLKAMLSPGKLNNGQNSGVEMDKSPAYTAGGFEYGYGLVLYNQEGHPEIVHGGGISGFTSWLSEWPKDHVTVAILSNTAGKDAGAFALADPIERAALGRAPKK